MARARRQWRFPWVEAISGVLLGLVIGAIAAIALGQHLAGVTTSPVPLPDSWTYRYNVQSLLVVAVIGAVIVPLGFVWRTERQFFNYLIIGSGLGVLLLGTTYLALEKIEVTPNGVVHRSWWGLYRIELKFAEVRQLRNVHHHRPWRRNSQWDSLQYGMDDGSQGTLCSNTTRNRLFFWAKLHILQSAGQHGVEITHEHDYGQSGTSPGQPADLSTTQRRSAAETPPAGRHARRTTGRTAAGSQP
jgi:hypothetical protein